MMLKLKSGNRFTAIFSFFYSLAFKILKGGKSISLNIN